MKITQQQLTNLLSLNSGKSIDLCERFINEFFSLIAENLGEGENIRIKGFGSFKIVDVSARRSVNVSTGKDYEIPGHSKIVFVPSKELATLVNQPFDVFEAVEIKDSTLPVWQSQAIQNDETQDTVHEIDEDIVTGPDSDDSIIYVATDSEINSDQNQSDWTEKRNLSAEEEEPNELCVVCDEEQNLDLQEIPDDNGEVVTDIINENNDEIQVNQTDDLNSESIGSSSGHIKDQESVGTSDLDPDPDPISSYSHHHRHHHRRRYKFAWGFFSGFLVCAVLLIAGLFAFKMYLDNKDQLEEENFTGSQAEMSEQYTEASPGASTTEDLSVKPVIEAETAPSDPQPVYDTVTTTRYLTTLAKEHYGNFNLWPYIYEENKNILGHPDRIRPGTKVVVPPLSKYGVDPNSPADIAKAKELGVQIYARYNKK